MKFNPIDLQKWPRGQIFYHFAHMAPTGYSLTVELDATALKRSLKAAECRLFPAYLWLITRNLNKQTESKIAEQEATPGFLIRSHPCMRPFTRMTRPFRSCGRRSIRIFVHLMLHTWRIRCVMAVITAYWRSRAHRRRTLIRCPASRGSAFHTLLCTATKTSPIIFLRSSPGSCLNRRGVC